MATYASIVNQVIFLWCIIIQTLLSKEIGYKENDILVETEQDVTKLGNYFSSIASDSCINPDESTKVKKCSEACGYDFSFLKTIES